MRTEDDVRAAFRSLEVDAPEPGTVLADFDRAVHDARVRRRAGATAVVAAAAAAVVAVLVVSTAVLGDSGPTTQGGPTPTPTPGATATTTGSASAPPPPVVTAGPTGSTTPVGRAAAPGDPCAVSSAPLDLTVPTVSPPSGWVVDGESVAACSGVRTREVRTPSGGTVGTLSLYSPGAFDPAPVRRGTTVPIGDRTGYRGTVAKKQAPGSEPPTREVEVLAWEYAPNAWAVIESGGRLNTAKAAELARGVDVRRPESFAVPVRLGHRPPGLLPREVGGTPPAGGYASGHIHLDPVTAKPCPDGFGCAAAVTIDVTPNGPDTGPEPSRTVRAGGHDATIATTAEGIRLGFRSGPWGVTLFAAAGVTEAELIRTAAELTVAPSKTDVTTWYDARTAVR